jgi:hypothetical protein
MRFQREEVSKIKFAGKILIVWFDCLAGTAVAFGKNCDGKLVANLSPFIRAVHTVNDPDIA